MATEMRLETPRLLLEPFSVEFTEALDKDRENAADIVGLVIPDGWPDADLSQLLAIYGPWLKEDSARLGYGPWIAAAEGAIVGSAGFQGTPKDAAIELGFGTHPDYRNRGYASEAAYALLAWGLSQPGVELIVAKCEPSNQGSIRVLEKIGMRRTGEAHGELLWEIRRTG